MLSASVYATLIPTSVFSKPDLPANMSLYTSSSPHSFLCGVYHYVCVSMRVIIYVIVCLSLYVCQYLCHYVCHVCHYVCHCMCYYVCYCVRHCMCLCRPSAGDMVIEAPHAVRTNVTRLRVRGKSPTVYEFNLTVTDQHNLTSWDTVLVTVTKGMRIL